MRKHGPENAILALSSQLATGREDLDELPGEIYLFRTHPIARKVAKLLIGFEPAPRKIRKKGGARKAARKKSDDGLPEPAGGKSKPRSKASEKKTRKIAAAKKDSNQN